MEVIRHIYRELNDLADGVAKEAWSRRTSYWKEFPAISRLYHSTPKYLRIFTDGSHRDGLASSGMVVFGAWEESLLERADYMANFCGTREDVQNLTMPTWELILEAGLFLGKTTIVDAELKGVQNATAFIRFVASRPVQG